MENVASGLGKAGHHELPVCKCQHVDCLHTRISSRGLDLEIYMVLSVISMEKIENPSENLMEGNCKVYSI